MPELAAVYALGILTAWILTGSFIVFWRKGRRGLKSATLRQNLRAAGLFWSEHHNTIEPWIEGADTREEASSLRTFLITGALLSLLSWLGTLFLLVLFVSYRVLARSRLERWLYSTELVRSPALPPENVLALINQARSQGLVKQAP